MNIDPGLFAQFGLLGAMLYWFMFRAEKKLDAHTETVSLLSRTILLDILSRETINETVRTEATNLLNRVSAARPSPPCVVKS